MLQLPLKFLLQPQLLLPARLRGVDDVLLAAATLGAHARGLLYAGVAQDVVGALDALLAAAGALGRLGQRFVLAVPMEMLVLDMSSISIAVSRSYVMHFVACGVHMLED